jgi:hypothetical protein
MRQNDKWDGQTEKVTDWKTSRSAARRYLGLKMKRKASGQNKDSKQDVIKC